MGYERNDRRFGRDQGYGRSGYPQGRDYERGHGRDRFEGSYGADPYGTDTDRDRDYDRNRGYGRERSPGDYGRQPQGYDYDDRGFLQRAGDEVRSWFGDEEAERRRRYDERYREREEDVRGSGHGDAYGTASRGGYGATGAGRDRAERGYDPNYRAWRDRQLESFDRDYDDYRREHQSRFDTEFHSWRTARQGQRETLGRVREHQEVVGSDGKHVGTVDKVRGDRIILTRSDQDADGHHHAVPCAWITEVADKVTITKTADEAQAHWRDEERTPAIGGGNDRQEDRIGADHNLNRSFSGTY